jgi:hypothetical protein
MLVTKLYVPEACLQGDRLITYILWPKNQETAITLMKPESWEIEEIYNLAQPPETRRAGMVFSHYVINGYLGIVFRIPLTEEISRADKLVIKIESGTGLSEEYEKEVTIFPQSAGFPEISYNHSNECGMPEKRIYGAEPHSNSRQPSDLPSNSGYPQFGSEKEKLTRAIQEVFSLTDAIRTDLRSEFRIEGNHLAYLCQQNLLNYDLVLVPTISRPLPKTVKFTHVVPSRAGIVHLPNLVRIPEAIVYTGDGYKIKLNHLAIREKYLLSLEFRAPDLMALDELIDKSCCRDMNNPSTRIQNFTISALLKYPEIFHSDDCDIEMQDIGISVDLQTDDLPHDFIESQKMWKENSALMKIFEKKIEILGDFSSRRKDIRYDFPIPSSCPDTISIVLYTNLSASKPAVSGILSLKSGSG